MFPISTRAASALAAVSLTMVMTPVAHAAPDPAASTTSTSASNQQPPLRTALVGDQSITGLSVDELDSSSVASRVEAAGSFKEVKKILMKEGFRIDKSASTAETVMFVKRAGGAAVKYEIWTQDVRDRMLADQGEVLPLAKVGWNWSKGGPYVEATAGEWKSFTKNGVSWASPLCGLIANVIGAVGCGVVANVVASYLDTIDTSRWPSDLCIAVSAQLRPWIERC